MPICRSSHSSLNINFHILHERIIPPMISSVRVDTACMNCTAVTARNAIAAHIMITAAIRQALLFVLPDLLSMALCFFNFNGRQN